MPIVSPIVSPIISSIVTAISEAITSLFSVKLQASLVPEAAPGDDTATLTLNTDSTFQDFEGLIRTALANQLRSSGSRVVINLLSDTATLAVSANKTVTVTIGTYVFSMGAGDSSGVATFSGTATGSSGTLTQNAANRTAKTLTITSAGTIVTTASVAILVDVQLEDVTGQANQNTASYVSEGVLSAPFHGSNIDGVQAFDTLNGNTVSSNVVTENTGALIQTYQYGILPGVIGSYISTPDSAAADISGSFIAYGYIAPQESSPVNNQAIISKYLSAGNQRSFSFAIGATGVLRLIISPGGGFSAGNNADSVSTIDIPGGIGYWAFAVYDASTPDVTFSTSRAPHSATVAEAFAARDPLGSPASVTATSIFNSIADVEVGSRDIGTVVVFQGSIFKSGLISGTDATAAPAVSYDANDFLTGSTQVSSLSGETYTYNGNAGQFAPNGTVRSPWDSDGPYGDLNEAAGSNFLDQSEALSTSPWVVSGPAILELEQGLAPNGKNTLNLLRDDGAGGAGEVDVQQPISVSGGADNRVSIWAKASKSDFLLIRTIDASDSNADGLTWFNLLTGVIATQSENHREIKIRSYPNGLYRCSITFDSDFGDALTVAFNCCNTDGVGVVNRDDTNSIFLWGAMINGSLFAAGKFTQSYIKTLTSSVNRDATDLTYNAVDNFALASEISFDFTALNITDTDTVLYGIAATGTFEITQQGTGIRATMGAETINAASVIVIGTPLTIKFVYDNDAGTGELFVDDVSEGTLSGATGITSPTKIGIGNDGANDNFANGSIRLVSSS